MEFKPCLDVLGGYQQSDVGFDRDLPKGGFDMLPPPLEIPCKNLEILILSKNELGHVGAVCINRLFEKVPSLKKIDLRVCRIHPDDHRCAQRPLQACK